MYTSDHDKLFLSQLDDAMLLCERRQKPYFFPFLSERKQEVARRYLDAAKFSTYRFFGGCEACERKQLGLYAYEEIETFPITALEITFRKADKLTHRDFLGALMSLGIERDTIGDIMVEDGRAVVFVSADISDYVSSQLFKIGNAGVRLSEADAASLPKGRGFEEVSCVVSSLRLDNVVSAITGLSREKSKNIIPSGYVSLNHLPCGNPSKAVAENDVMSIRGKGKYIINGVLGETKKHRIRISILHYR